MSDFESELRELVRRHPAPILGAAGAAKKNCTEFIANLMVSARSIDDR